MKMQRHFEIENGTTLRETAQIETVIVDLNRTVQILACDIATEEEHAQVSDPFDVAYPILARVLAARRDNLKITIAALHERLLQIKVAAIEAITIAV